ncbi:ATP-binding protein [Jeotgalibaca ciconiae]|uniref:ATP-binding protein n=1 Tax=Jeotgalibaca ciconiae TaxID=2496265 RepID=UPI001D130D9D|nr:ATP-binding protein [Jeotgalibaca ciconiae]HJB23633.1 ATP-binding protein [Candidatus Jeotgalibaca pullicola]
MGMDIMDLTSLFGNAIDNAIEHVQKIEDKDKRLITLKLTSKGKMAVLRVDNYCIDELDMVGDLPRTSKRDKENHGYGLKSIQYIAKKYNGNTTINLEDNWFTLSVVFPIIK